MRASIRACMHAPACTRVRTRQCKVSMKRYDSKFDRGCNGGKTCESIHGLHTYMAYVVTACIVMAYTVMTYLAMAYIVMAYIAMAYIVMAFIVMVYIVMANSSREVARQCKFHLFLRT